MSQGNAPMNGGARGLTSAYIVMGLCVVGATMIALYSLHYAQSGKNVCEYVKATYPASHTFRLQSKRFVYDHYLQLKTSARAYRNSAAQDPDLVTARLDRKLADILDEHARVALSDWRKIRLPGPPTCS